MMNCPALTELSGFRPGDDAEHDDALRAHLADCATCRGMIELAHGFAGLDAGPGDGDRSAAMSAGCMDLAPLLAVMVDAKLDADDQELVDRHLTDCTRCAAVTASLMLDREDSVHRYVSRGRRGAVVVAGVALAAAAALALAWISDRGSRTGDDGREPASAAHVASPANPAVDRAGPPGDTAVGAGAARPGEPVLPLVPSAEALSSGVTDQRSRLRACAEQHREVITGTSHKATITLRILPHGGVSEVSARPASPLASCYEGVFRGRWLFPESRDGGVLVTPIRIWTTRDTLAILIGHDELEHYVSERREAIFHKAMALEKVETRVGQALELCRETLDFTPGDRLLRVVCGAAACRAKDAEQARVWLQDIKVQRFGPLEFRKRLVGACRDIGVELGHHERE